MTRKRLVINRVKRIIRDFGTRDPFAVASCLGVDVCFSDDSRETPGFFSVYRGESEICISSNLPDAAARIVCAHELGHLLMCRKRRKAGACRGIPRSFLDVEEWRGESLSNLFAAELLVPDESVRELMDYGYDFFACAEMLSVPAPLLSLKLRLMEEKGYVFPSYPSDYPPEFLREWLTGKQ